MIRTPLVIASAALTTAFFARPPAQGTELARRIAAAPDGLVKMTYASRDGVCGDGRSFIADATSRRGGYDIWFVDGISMTGTMADIESRCARGPVRLLLVVRNHRVIDVQPFVGPASVATERTGTELGTVSTAEVSRYLLDLAARGGDATARDAILAASVADSVRVAGPLAAMARDKSLGQAARETALRWVDRVAAREGDSTSPRVVRSILEDATDHLAIRERAVRVIGESGEGSAYLRALYPRLDDPPLRERIVRVVGESATSADAEWVRGVALDPAERTSIRERAVRMVGEAGDSRGLRELYDKLDTPSLRERVIRLMAEVGDGESRRWLRAIAERRTEPAAVRERAVRSLAEAGAATSELVSLYDAVTDRGVRERLVSVLADRGDRASRDKLRSIATDDPDAELRRRAVNRLAEK
jgi:HEAT repeat protein